MGTDRFPLFYSPLEKMLQQRCEKWELKNKMGWGDFKNFSGKKRIRKIFHPLGCPLHLFALDHGNLLKNIFTIATLGTRGLVAIVDLKMFEEPIQSMVVDLNEITHLSIKNPLQFGDLHDVDMFRLNKIFQMDGGKGPFSGKGEEV